MVITSRSCPWCHAEVSVEIERCPECGHNPHLPRLDCDCLRCRELDCLAVVLGVPAMVMSGPGSADGPTVVVTEAAPLAGARDPSPADIVRAIGASCSWCDEPLQGEVVLDPTFDADGLQGADGAAALPDILHAKCAGEKRLRVAEWDHHTRRGTPLGLALLHLAELANQLDAGKAVILMPRGRDGQRLLQAVASARGNHR